MSYTESDVIERIYKEIRENVHPLYHIMKDLIGWYEHQKVTAEVNDWDTTELKKKIDNLRGML